MGVEGSKMGISAMAIVSGICKDDILKLRSSFDGFSERSGGNKDVFREDFDNAVKSLENLDPSDVELLDKLFILLDETGENKVDVKDFLLAVSLLVDSGSPKEKLLLAFEVFDESETGTILALDCKKVFTTLNSTASYFGDPVLSSDEINELVDAIWQEYSIPSAPIQYADCIDFILQHDIAVKFINGNGSVRFES